jgi:CubicO group peptidase (beta-lactamase class C family)
MIRNAGLVLLCAAWSASASAAPLHASLARIETGLLPGATIVGEPTRQMRLAERMAHHKVPAISIALIEGGRIAWTRAYGSAAAGVPATPSTLFQAASISKPVAAAAALQLVHEKRLSLDAPVNAHLRSWRVPDGEAAKGSEVTLRGLLSHSAGLSVHGFRGYAQGEAVPSLRQLLDGAKPANSDPVRIIQPPGKWRYSGGGTSVMQQLVEDTAARPFPDVLRALVLGPAGMRDSSYAQPIEPAWARRAAVAHDEKGAAIPGRWHVYPEQAAAGLWTTPTDLARFALWVMEGRRDARNATPGQRFAARHLTEPQPGLQPGRDERMGLGLFLEGEGQAFRFSHGGSNAGFRATLLAFPETGQGAVIMTNGDGGAPLIQEVLRSIAAEYRWPARFHDMIVPARVDAAQLDLLAGTYRWAPEEPARVSFARRADGLVAQRASGEPARLVPVGGGTFVDPESRIRFHFADGSVVIEPPRGPKLTAKRTPQ